MKPIVKKTFKNLISKVTKILRGNINFTVESIEMLAAWQESHAAKARGDYVTETAEAHIARLKKKSSKRAS